MNRKRRQCHTCQTLENRAFRHDHAIILDQGDALVRPGHQATLCILRRALARGIGIGIGIGIDVDIPRRHPQEHLILREFIVLILGVLVRVPRRR